MKYLKRFNESFNRNVPSMEEVLEFLLENKPPAVSLGFGEFATFDEWAGIRLREKITINSDGTVDFDGSLTIRNVPNGKLPFKFGKVSGKFRLKSVTVTTLEGCPDYCESFYAQKSIVKNLVGGPIHVETNYDVSKNNELTSLEGSPKTVGGDFNFNSTKVTSLIGGPEEVGGNFDGDFTPLVNLVGSPRIVGGMLKLSETDLTSLEGLPDRTKWIVAITKSGTLWDPRPLRDCETTFANFDDIDKKEPIYYLIKLFVPKETRSILESLDKIYPIFRESLDYNYVRGTAKDPQVNLFRLKEALDESGLELPNESPNKFFNGKYRLVDDEGRSVDFRGKPIGMFRKFFGF